MAKKDVPLRATFMTAADRAAMGNMPRTHQNCMDKTKKARPGKTAHDRAKCGQ